MKIHPVINVSQLEDYLDFKRDLFEHPTAEKPPPLKIGSHDEFEIDQILTHSFDKKKKAYSYFVKWKGYEIEDSTWEPEDNLEHCKAVLKKYKSSHKLWT